MVTALVTPHEDRDIDPMAVAGDSARRGLRRATASHHEAVDRAFSRYDLTSRTGYIDFLTAQAAAFLPVEAAIDAADTGLVDDWPRRRRSHLLRQDLAALDSPAPPVRPEPALNLASPHAVLGAVYVLEGSRLGGSLLARQVPAGWPRQFVTAGDSALWRSLLTMLEKGLVTDDHRATAVTAARAVHEDLESSAAGGVP